MTDRRRFNGPAGGTAPPVFSSSLTPSHNFANQRPQRSRRPQEMRKIFLKTGLTPSASGSAYLELEPFVSSDRAHISLNSASSAVKLACTVHGPRSLPRSAPFAPQVLLSTHIKFAPFAARRRRGYIRDSSERDLAVHLDTALRGVIIGYRWPKSGIDIVITVLEGEEEHWWMDELSLREKKCEGLSALGMMTILSSCITVASAALVDAGIDCFDLVSGGVAAIVQPSSAADDDGGCALQLILDPAPSEYKEILASCAVGYTQSRDEITELWFKSGSRSLQVNNPEATSDYAFLVDGAVQAALAARLVLVEAVKDSVELDLKGAKAAS